VRRLSRRSSEGAEADGCTSATQCALIVLSLKMIATGLAPVVNVQKLAHQPDLSSIKAGPSGPNRRVTAANSTVQGRQKLTNPAKGLRDARNRKGA